MFLGHFAIGFAAKRYAPRASLGTLFLAAQFIDLLHSKGSGSLSYDRHTASASLTS